jgi:hypothetical protein
MPYLAEGSVGIGYVVEDYPLHRAHRELQGPAGPVGRPDRVHT